ncbi:unnamed protein product, partial [Symbiodinium microadriaticum]
MTVELTARPEQPSREKMWAAFHKAAKFDIELSSWSVEQVDQVLLHSGLVLSFVAGHASPPEFNLAEPSLYWEALCARRLALPDRCWRFWYRGRVRVRRP